MTERVYNVLFLCTGNSARSILAESLLNHWGAGKFHAYSAGSHPKGQVHPMAVELLRRTNLPTENLRSKGWDEFAAPGAPKLDFVFTVCDNAAGEACPVWPGKPITAHWGIADPAAVEGTDAEKAFAFRQALGELETRVKLFTSLPIASLDGMTLQARLREIGKGSAVNGSA
jgi:protein-tyrosine-phosphatase